MKFSNFQTSPQHNSRKGYRKYCRGNVKFREKNLEIYLQETLEKIPKGGIYRLKPGVFPEGILSKSLHGFAGISGKLSKAIPGEISRENPRGIKGKI